MPNLRERTLRQAQGRQLLAALRRNLALLQELATHYEVGTASTCPRSSPARVRQPGDAAALLRPEMAGLVQEQLRVLLLDTKNRVVGQHLIYQGNISSAVVRPAEVFREALLANAPRIVVAHNHPSGDPEPSPEDVQVTAQLLQAGQILGIELLDHLVVGRDSEVSLRSRRLPPGAAWPA